MSKRKTESTKDIREKIRRLESKLEKKRRRRIIDSSSSDDESTQCHSNDEYNSDIPLSTLKSNDVPSGSGVDDTEPPTTLDEDILALLGDAPQCETGFGKPIHKDIATRWQDILVKGLSKDVKENILKEYQIPSNCEMFLAPKLNAETKAAIADNLVKRDLVMEKKQNHIGIALAALAQAMHSILEKDFSTHKLLKYISDASRILADSHYNETKTRRHFIISSINSEMKDTMLETVRDKYLFGENISEKLKSAKTIQKSGSDLRPHKPGMKNRVSKFDKNNFIKSRNVGQLNWKPLQRKSMGRADAGSRTAQQQPRAGRSGVQQREVAEQSPPPRSLRQRTRRRQ